MLGSGPKNMSMLIVDSIEERTSTSGIIHNSASRTLHLHIVSSPRPSSPQRVFTSRADEIRYEYLRAFLVNFELITGTAQKLGLIKRCQR